MVEFSTLLRVNPPCNPCPRSCLCSPSPLSAPPQRPYSCFEIVYPRSFSSFFCFQCTHDNQRVQAFAWMARPVFAVLDALPSYAQQSKVGRSSHNGTLLACAYISAHFIFSSGKLKQGISCMRISVSSTFPRNQAHA